MKKEKENAVNMLVRGDLSLKEIAMRLKISEKTLYNWRQDPEFEREYNRRLKETERRLRRRIYKNVDTALDRLKLILTTSQNDNAAARAAKDILDRAGYSPDKNMNIRGKLHVEIINGCIKKDEGR